jgi:hypothetical protein
MMGAAVAHELRKVALARGYACAQNNSERKALLANH